MRRLIRFISQTHIQILIIIVATVLVYSNMLHNQFVIDDHLFVIDWQVTKSLKNIPAMFIKEFVPSPDHGGVYRPFRTLFYALSYQLWGSSNPTPYHVQSLFVHLTITILIYFIVALLAGENLIALLASLLFGLHPIHTEAINYITASFDTIGAVFFFASFLFFLRSINKKRIYNLDYFISVALALVAFFNFEMTLTLPLLIILYDLCFRKQLFKQFKAVHYVKLYSPYVLSAISFLFVRIFLLHITARGEYLAGSPYLTFLTMVKAVIFYIKTLILPTNLSINPTIAEGINSWVGPVSKMDKILSQNVFNTDIVINLAIIIAILVIAWKSYRKLPIMTFAIVWFFISLLPVSYIIPQGPIAQERYIYIASFGFCLLFAYVVNYLYQKTYPANLQLIIKFTLSLVLIVTLTSYFYLTYQRNKDWKDSSGVWLKLVEQIPDDIYTNYLVGLIYERSQKDDLASIYFQKALASKPNLADGYLHLGKIYQKQGNIKLALENYSQALLIYPDFLSSNEVLKQLVEIPDKSFLAIPRQDGYWIKYLWETNLVDQKVRLLFFYPQDWKVQEFDNQLVINDSNQGFTVVFSVDESNLSPEDYMKNQTSSFGQLINQGLAQMPNFNSAFVKVWKDQDLTKMQFFLAQKDTVVKILVYPAEGSNMKKFDQILQSIVVEYL